MHSVLLGLLLWGTAGSVRLDDVDALWAARMVIGSQTAGAREAGCTGHSDAASARLWVAANRHALLVSRGHRFAHWRDSFRAYSTAIAPQWTERGWCAPGGRMAGSAMCSPERLHRRASVSSLSWTTIGSRYCDLRGYVERFMRGDIAAPSGIDGASETDCRGCSRAPPGAVFIGSNWWAPPRGGPEVVLRLRVRLAPPEGGP